MGIFHTEPRKKKSTSEIWRYIHEVYSENQRVVDAYYCIDCQTVIYNANSDGNTNKFRRHTCMKKTADNKIKILIRKETKNELKEAAAKFIVKDIRPFLAIEGEGIFDLLLAVMKFGQRNPKATNEHLLEALPSRNTVRSSVSKLADEIKTEIMMKLQLAKDVGGFAVVSDIWTDNYRGLSYICLVAHCNVLTDNGIEKHRFTLHVNEITEIVKNKEVIIKYLNTVLGEYGLSEDDIRKFVLFVTDRGSNYKYGLLSNNYQRHN